MRATLEFDLNDPDDVQAHLRCLKSLDMAIIFFEIAYNLRKKMIRQADKYSDTFDEGVYATLDRINELLDDNDININSLID